MVDIGGASTEIIIGKGLEAQRYESFRMGCVNTSIRFFREGKITQKSLDRAITACAAELEDLSLRLDAALTMSAMVQQARSEL